MNNNKKLILAIPTDKLISKTALSKYLSKVTDVKQDTAFNAVNRYVTHLEKANKIHKEPHGRTNKYKFTNESLRYLKEQKYKKDFPTAASSGIDFNKLLSSVWVTGSTINGCGNLHR